MTEHLGVCGVLAVVPEGNKVLQPQLDLLYSIVQNTNWGWMHHALHNFKLLVMADTRHQVVVVPTCEVIRGHPRIQLLKEVTQ